MHLEETTIENAIDTFQKVYSNQDYLGAMNVLENNPSMMSKELWHYNLGIISSKVGNFALARYHYLMAESYGLKSSELFIAKKLVEEKLEVKNQERPYEMGDYFYSSAFFGSHGLFTTIALVFLISGLWQLKGKQTKQAIILFLLTLLPLGMNWWVGSWTKSIVIDSVVVFHAPSVAFGSNGEIPAGTMLITDEQEGWLRVMYPSKFTGWIKPQGLKILEQK